MKILITENYLTRESRNPERSIDWITDKGESVKEWVKNYCKRNNIQIKFLENGENWRGENINQIELTFKSERQLNCFVTNGNKNFPYFEFL